MSYLNYNGKIISADKEIIKADNRGFRYGDGLFETMRMVRGEIPLAILHFERLMNGIELLQFEKPAYLTHEYFVTQIREVAKKNNHFDQVRVRLMIFRSDGGLYDPQNHFPNYIIQTWELPAGPAQLNENGLIIDIFPDSKIAPDRFSHLKSNNYLPYVMAALHVKRNQLNDSLLLNSNNNICDTTIANIFIVKEGSIITPPLSEGCVSGVMRRHLLKKFSVEGLSALERSLTITDLLHADEIFLSNAIYGIKWVRQFREAQYKHGETRSIFNNIIKKIF